MRRDVTAVLSRSFTRPRESRSRRTSSTWPSGYDGEKKKIRPAKSGCMDSSFSGFLIRKKIFGGLIVPVFLTSLVTSVTTPTLTRAAPLAQKAAARLVLETSAPRPHAPLHASPRLAVVHARRRHRSPRLDDIETIVSRAGSPLLADPLLRARVSPRANDRASRGKPLSHWRVLREIVSTLA